MVAKGNYLQNIACACADDGREYLDDNPPSPEEPGGCRPSVWVLEQVPGDTVLVRIGLGSELP